jgi:hypothetical protein
MTPDLIEAASRTAERLRTDRGQFLQQPDAFPFVEKYRGRAGRGPAFLK